LPLFLHFRIDRFKRKIDLLEASPAHQLYRLLV